LSRSQQEKECLTAIALGAGDKPKVWVHFRRGKPTAVEMAAARIPVENLDSYLRALKRCPGLVEAFK